jgi:two-component system, chemotaxis family, sensor kinase CheA
MHVVESAAEEIARKLDEIATDIILTASAPADPHHWAESLAALAVFAKSSNYADVAGLAASLVGSMRASGDSESDDDVRSEIARGVERLRAALELSQSSVSTAAMPALADDPELVNDFVSESREHLESIESQVLTLERDAANTEAIHSVFRSFHTIKGLAGFLGFEIVQQLTHEVETVLDLARNGQLAVTEEAIDLILESKDYVAAWLRSLDVAAGNARPAPPAADQVLLGRIQRLIDGGEVSAAPAAISKTSSADAGPALTSAIPSVSAPAYSSQVKIAARSVKVDTSKLDYLVDMVGEMVIAQSLVRHDPELKIENNSRVGRNLSQLARITDEVQRTAMAMRMVPVGPLFQKMVRLVRDLSRKFGKQIRVETVGEDVDLDRNIVEELADPLMHMIRNAVDHGIETPAERTAAGKDATACVTLRAFHRSGHIVIEVSDDGRGINRAKVIDRARKNGLIGATAQVTDAECHNLIFQPGFSTAEKVSDVSGRGVGMDVVRKQILKLRGSVELQSTEGRGTVFSLRLPLTLAIIDGLVVMTGSERYILPLASIKELFRPVAGQVSTVEGRAEVVAVRDKLVPVIRLYEKFGIQPRTTDVLASVFVMAEIDGVCFCIMVDDLIGKQEVVIKNLGSAFRDVPGIAGGAILGDGRVGLILDLQTLFMGNRDARS